MEIEQKIFSALLQQSPDEFRDVRPEYLLHLQESVYHLRYPGHELFLKWISLDDRYGLNEIRANREFLTNPTTPAPHLLFTVETGEAILAGWEWLEGGDLREHHREYLPAAFSLLGHFHNTHRHSRAVCSLVTHQTFPSISELLRAEAAFLSPYYDPACEERIAGIFSRMEAGYPTVIHGDMHPGNIRMTSNGLKFVDWGYSVSSLNLFDLGYVQSIAFDTDEPAWWNITPGEAQFVLQNYFAVCGMAPCNYLPIHRAVMLWGELWSLYNCAKNHLDAEAAGPRKNINMLLNEN